MGRKNIKSAQKKKKRNNPPPKSQWNFLAEAGPGCFIARRDKSPDWMIEWEDVDPEEFEGVEVPDVAIDPEDRTLSLCNVDSFTKIAYITVFDNNVLGADGNELPLGSSTDNKGVTNKCITFIVLCPPKIFAHLCFLDVPPGEDITQVRIESDVQKWEQHPNPQDEHTQRLWFPLQGGPFLCTQGENGELTHFFSGNLHAIDFRCPIGTPLIAVADGVVVEAKDTNTLTGVAVSNLFEWNSIIIRLDDDRKQQTRSDGPLFVEYVHIQKANVQAGDRVNRGQVIGESGSVGFSPEPHLHFSAFRSAEPTAPTVRVRFEASSEEGPTGHAFLPRAGNWYSGAGMVEPPPT